MLTKAELYELIDEQAVLIAEAVEAFHEGDDEKVDELLAEALAIVDEAEERDC